MIKIRIKGFQSIREETTLEVESFTCLTGESNRGKSAIIRAMLAALSNRLGTDFITVGEEACEVEITANGHTLLWKKSKKGTTYIIDGVEHSKVGRNIPDEAALLGIKEITTQDKKKHWPQVQKQHDGPFIVAEPSPAITAELIGANEDLLILTKAIKLAKEDLGKAKQLEDLLTQQLLTTKQRLEQLNQKLGPLDQAQQNCSASFASQEQIQKRLEIIEDLRDEFNRSTRLKESLTPVLSLTYPTPPNGDRATKLVQLHKIYGHLLRIKNTTIPNTVPSEPLSTTQKAKFAKLESLKERHGRISRTIFTLNSYLTSSKVPEIEVSKKIEAVLFITRLYDRHKRLTKEAETLNTLTKEVPQDSQARELYQRFQKLAKIRDSLRVLMEEEESSKLSLDTLEKELKTLEANRSRLLNELNKIDYCLLCGSELKPDQVKSHLETVGL
jgi:DNA repair ATPase RecN